MDNNASSDSHQKVPRAVLKPKEERRLLRGHLWGYRNEFEKLPDVADGAIVDAFSALGRFVGRGFFQASGGIAVRVLSRSEKPIDAEFLARRVERALRYRQRVFPGSDAYRWIHGESDGLPGLIADRFGPVVSVQTQCAFYAQHADALAKAFLGHEGVRGMRFEFASKARWFGTPVRPLVVALDGLQLDVDVDSGQKTGMFLDQRENALNTRVYAPDARVLDGHCYNGLWSCHLALGGAKHVLGVDTSGPALDQARKNAALNGVEDGCEFECIDVQEVLKRGERFDVITLDPPALAKSRAHAEKALGVYHALNRDAMAALTPGGILISSSCSHFVDAEAFLEMLKRAARAAQREAWILEVRGAARDHPVLMSMPETSYLKCVAMRVF